MSTLPCHLPTSDFSRSNSADAGGSFGCADGVDCVEGSPAPIHKAEAKLKLTATIQKFFFIFISLSIVVVSSLQRTSGRVQDNDFHKKEICFPTRFAFHFQVHECHAPPPSR